MNDLHTGLATIRLQGVSGPLRNFLRMTLSPDDMGFFQALDCGHLGDGRSGACPDSGGITK